jgi:murein DD-endopeptidase MepM/ murein hydrolase activator NlpD
MKRVRRHHVRAVGRRVLFLVAFAFLAGMAVMALIMRASQTLSAVIVSAPADADVIVEAPPDKQVDVNVKPSLREVPPAVASPPMHRSPGASTPVISADPIAELRQRDLALPVHGITRRDIRDGFNEMRGGARRHEAIDVLAPRHTPVLAVEDGTVGRLFLSEAGGITVYQFDPTERYVYYYAHLENYAAGLKEKSAVKRGETIGYVGTSGNAPRDTPHLHFAIFKMTDEKKWWQGTPIDPYSVLR